MNTTWIILAGLPATGKSTLAKQLATQLERSAVLDKDRIRAALFPGPTTNYTAEQDGLCMRAMIDAATYMTSQRLANYILFDGRTFSRQAHINQAIAAAEAIGAGWKLLHLTCSDKVAEARLKAADPHHPAANRDAMLYYRVKAEFEPILRQKLDLDTTEGVDPVLQQALNYIHP